MSRIEGYKAGSGGSPEEGVTTCDGAGLGEEGTAPRFPPGPRSQSHLLLAHGTWGLDLYPGVGGLLDATQSLSGGRREGKARPNGRCGLRSAGAGEGPGASPWARRSGDPWRSLLGSAPRPTRVCSALWRLGDVLSPTTWLGIERCCPFFPFYS